MVCRLTRLVFSGGLKSTYTYIYSPRLATKQISQIEWETEQLKVFDALKSGNQVLEEIHKVRIPHRYTINCLAVAD